MSAPPQARTDVQDGRPIVLFDGLCNLCNGAVDFILRRDGKGEFRFASLQSKAGEGLARERGIPPDRMETLVLIEGQRTEVASRAVMAIARKLGWPWRAIAVFMRLPRWTTDPLYYFVARNRYRLFGKRDACRLPTPAERARFLS